MREAKIIRNTSETQIKLDLCVDGSGKSNIKTGCGFLNHMLTLFSKHGRLDINIECIGDIDVDYHHTTEDIGIALGQALKEALGDKKGIVRYGNMILPMDETLILSAIDLSGRCYLGYDVTIPSRKIGDFDSELVEEFFFGLSRSLECNLHIKQLSGTNSHHIAEGIFKCVAKSLSQAMAISEKYADEIPSTKGVL